MFQQITSEIPLFSGMLVLDTNLLGRSPLNTTFKEFRVELRIFFRTDGMQTYQLARAFTAVTLKDATVDVARIHALQLIKLEESLHILWEVQIQQYFLRHPILIAWTNRLYSFIHIPGTIAFLVWLYYYTTTRHRSTVSDFMKLSAYPSSVPAGSTLYQARRRTLAFCNLVAFLIFTLWPCMPPRLLSDPSVNGSVGELSRSYGFVDTVHGVGGASSVWTQNKFCNQYAAIPSLHFGYSLMIGVTIMAIRPPTQHHRSQTLLPHFLDFSHPGLASKAHRPSWQRIACTVLGITYPFTILVAIVATGNHFILDAFAGAIICGLGWWGNSVLLNLLPLEDYFFWILRIHKPEQGSICLRPSFIYDHCDEDQGMML